MCFHWHYVLYINCLNVDISLSTRYKLQIVIFTVVCKGIHYKTHNIIKYSLKDFELIWEGYWIDILVLVLLELIFMSLFLIIFFNYFLIDFGYFKSLFCYFLNNFLVMYSKYYLSFFYVLPVSRIKGYFRRDSKIATWFKQEWWEVALSRNDRK